MKSVKLILLTALSFLTMQSFAQPPLESLRKMFSSGAVSISAEYEMIVQQMPVVGNSEILLQGKMYHLQGNGLEVFCNGDALWTIDESSKEIVIEPCDALYDAYVANPLLLLAELDSYFQIKSQKQAGSNTEYVLHAIKDCGISQAQLSLSIDGRVLSGSFLLEDGTAVMIKVADMKKADPVSESAFTPSRTFSSDWIITDLR
jgi:hypothetical protein